MTTNEPITTPESTTDESRWGHFTDSEVMIIKESCRDFVDRILVQAGKDEIEADFRHDAALTMLGAANLITEIDEATGQSHPPFEVFALSAQLISTGKYAETLIDLESEIDDDTDAIVGDSVVVPDDAN